MTGALVAFPGVDLEDIYQEKPKEATLSDWLHHLASVMEDLDTAGHAVLIFQTNDGSQGIATKSLLPREQLLGMLHIAMAGVVHGRK